MQLTLKSTSIYDFDVDSSMDSQKKLRVVDEFYEDGMINDLDSPEWYMHMKLQAISI